MLEVLQAFFGVGDLFAAILCPLKNANYVLYAAAFASFIVEPNAAGIIEGYTAVVSKSDIVRGARFIIVGRTKDIEGDGFCVLRPIEV